MPAIDEFSISLLEEAKGFLEKAEEKQDSLESLAYLHASLMIAFCSLEAHVNGIASDFNERPDLSPLDRSILFEKDVRLLDGEFQLSGFKIFRLEDRILFLHKRFSGRPINREASFWSELSEAIKLRNQLTHPKDAAQVTTQAVQRALLAIIATIDTLYQAVYRRPFPAAARGLQSRLSF